MRNIKITVLGLLGATFLTTGLYSCSNDDATLTDNVTTEQAAMAAKSVFNYEIYGTTHNEYLDYVSAHPNFHNFTFDQNFAYGQTFSNQYFDFSQINVSSDEMREAIDRTIEALTAEGGEVAYLLGNNLISEDEEVLCSTLLAIFENAIDTEEDTYKSINEFNTDILNFENMIKENYPIVFKEEEVSIGAKYLIASSIAKNSYAYWIGSALNPMSEYHIYLGDNFILGNENTNTIYGTKGGIFKKIWDGIKIGVADVLGFIGNVCEGNGQGGECTITID